MAYTAASKTTISALSTIARLVLECNVLYLERVILSLKISDLTLQNFFFAHGRGRVLLTQTQFSCTDRYKSRTNAETNNGGYSHHLKHYDVPWETSRKMAPLQDCLL